jgi:hypothetical protein
MPVLLSFSFVGIYLEARSVAPLQLYLIKTQKP